MKIEIGKWYYVKGSMGQIFEARVVKRNLFGISYSCYYRARNIDTGYTFNKYGRIWSWNIMEVSE